MSILAPIALDPPHRDAGLLGTLYFGPKRIGPAGAFDGTIAFNVGSSADSFKLDVTGARNLWLVRRYVSGSITNAEVSWFAAMLSPEDGATVIGSFTIIATEIVSLAAGEFQYESGLIRRASRTLPWSLIQVSLSVNSSVDGDFGVFLYLFGQP